MPRPTTTTLGLPLGPRSAGTPILPALTGTPKILAAGDSMTVGSGSAQGSCYRGVLDTYMTDAGDMPHQWVGTTTDGNGLWHHGVSGRKIAELDAAITAVLASTVPDILLLFIGRNDMTLDADADAAPAAYASLLATIYAARPTLRLVVGHITPELDTANYARTVAFRAALPAVWEASAAYADGLLLTCDGGRDLAPRCRSHMPDGVHPNDVPGYELIADRFWPRLRNAFGLAASW